MKKKTTKMMAIILATLSCSACTTLGNSDSTSSSSTVKIEKWEYLLDDVTEVKNVVLLIGDGMGPEQIKAGEIYKGESLNIQKFPYQVKVNTNSLEGTTDSAAAATAMATGKLTYNGCVGYSLREQTGGNLTELETIVDIASLMGKSTGVLTTETIAGATPMGFSGHSVSRNDPTRLINSAATTSNVNLFAGYTCDEAWNNIFKYNGYHMLESVDDISESTEDKIFGAYNITGTAESMTAGEEIAFDYLVTEALNYLSQDEDGFFLMAEGAHIDHGGHNNDMKYMLEELLAFDDAVEATLEWAKGRTDTVVIVTADHETGGLSLGENVTKENILETENGNPVNYHWGTTGHTDTAVWCFINGADIDFSEYSLASNDLIKNTDIFQIIKDLFEYEVVSYNF